MNSKIFILAFAACYCQVTLAQRPTILPMPLGTAPPFLGSFNTNWVRPYYTAAAEGWRTYFEQLQQARNQLYQTLSNLQNSVQNASRNSIAQILSAMPVHTKQADDDVDESREILGDLQAPAVEAPAHDVPQEVQVVQTVTRPQVQNDAAKARPQQATVTHVVSQAQPAARQPQTVTSAPRPVASQVSSGVVSQVPSGLVPQVPSGVVSQVGSQMVPQVGGQIVPQVGSQLPSWVGK